MLTFSQLMHGKKTHGHIIVHKDTCCVNVIIVKKLRHPIITFTPWTPHWRQVNDVERDCKGRLALCRGLGCPRKTSFLSF